MLRCLAWFAGSAILVLAGVATFTFTRRTWSWRERIRLAAWVGTWVTVGVLIAEVLLLVVLQLLGLDCEICGLQH